MGAGEDLRGDTSHEITSVRPLPALLSQVLVAFTLELDNEFERRMCEAGYPGAALSLVVWTNLLRFVGESGISVRDLAKRALAPENGVKAKLGCLERWKFVKLEPDPADARPIPMRPHRLAGRMLRDGWGSGRGVRAEWLVRLTSKGSQARETWPPLFGLIETRWEKRFGKDEIGRLRKSLESVAERLEFELPHGLPVGYDPDETFRPRATGAEGLPIPTLLSQLLLAFRMEFDGESPAPLPMCATTLRVLGEQPLPAAEIPRLTGASPETSGIGWQHRPYVVVEANPAARRGKVVRLSPRGLKAQQVYQRLVAEIEARWETRFGRQEIGGLRESLHGLFERYRGDRPVLAEGLIPAPGTIRAADQAPRLGQRSVGTAQRQRARDLVTQTEEFIRDPAGALPHYPLWDMNRGFGP